MTWWSSWVDKRAALMERHIEQIYLSFYLANERRDAPQLAVLYCTAAQHVSKGSDFKQLPERAITQKVWRITKPLLSFIKLSGTSIKSSSLTSSPAAGPVSTVIHLNYAFVIAFLVRICVCFQCLSLTNSSSPPQYRLKQFMPHLAYCTVATCSKA